ncbi:MAG: type 1 glutamine amidotransferase [Gammaproteobacteria bacterium]|nr:type 1 glutamine amidotransferase [Gammaproteobacteria bacterium]
MPAERELPGVRGTTRGGIGVRSRYALIWCEDADKWQTHRGRWPGLMQTGECGWDVFEVYDGRLPARVSDYAGYVVSGSHYSCLDDSLVWLSSLFEFLRACVHASGPAGRIVAGCFGQQAIARALDGEVQAGAKFVVGREHIELSPNIVRHPRGEVLIPNRTGPSGFSLYQSHGDVVTTLPPGALAWARSPTAPYEIFTIGQRVLAFQGHPELTAADVRTHILPYLVSEQRVSEDQARCADRSLDRPVDADRLLELARRFLKP